MVMFNAKQILELRKAMGLTQPEFAKLIGVTASAVCLWESGKRHPPYKKMLKINEVAKKAGLIPAEKQPA